MHYALCIQKGAMPKQQLLKYAGSVSQLGGIRDFTFNDGKMKGVLAIEVNTGKLKFTILPDRCMDIANAEFCGENLVWISKTGITAPTYYEKDGKNWLHGFFGGLMTTCGLRNIGGPVDEHGLHGRIANTPAEKVSVFADWVDDEYVMKISGEMRESCVFGDNLVLKRTITAKLFEDTITVEDTIINEGFEAQNIALCYHCNFGYPLVSETAKLINIPEEHCVMSAPIHGKEEECITVEYPDDVVRVGIENNGIGAYITYNRSTLPDFVMWKMLGESEYVIGLEPRTARWGGANIGKNNAYVKLEPFTEYKTIVKFRFENLK